LDWTNPERCRSFTGDLQEQQQECSSFAGVEPECCGAFAGVVPECCRLVPGLYQEGF